MIKEPKVNKIWMFLAAHSDGWFFDLFYSTNNNEPNVTLLNKKRNHLMSSESWKALKSIMQRKNNRNMDLEYSTWESLYNSNVLDSLQRRQILYFDLLYSTTNNELRSNVPLPNKLKTNIKCRESWQATTQMSNSRNMDLEYSSCCCE